MRTGTKKTESEADETETKLEKEISQEAAEEKKM